MNLIWGKKLKSIGNKEILSFSGKDWVNDKSISILKIIPVKLFLKDSESNSD